VCDVDCVGGNGVAVNMFLASIDVDVNWLTRALFFPHSLLSTSPTFTFELLHKFRWLAGARGKVVVRVVAADQAGNVELERGVRGAFLGFRRDSRFFGSSIVFLSMCGVLAPVALLECVVHVLDMWFTWMRMSRFDSFEVCPGGGTVVTTIVACGVPEWWHRFGYGWYLYPVWVMVCGGTSYTNLSGVDVELCFVEVVWVGYGSVLVFSVLDISSELASRWLTRALLFPHSLLSTSPTFTFELLHEFRWLAGARGKVVVRVVAADQAGNVELECGVRGAFLGFRRDSRFFGSSIVFLRQVCLLCSGFVPVQCGTVKVCVVFLDTLTPSRFYSFEVCPGGGTVVTAIVACGVPEWWHRFGYGCLACYGVPCYGTDLLVVFVLVPCGN
ncbi:hypothetical protein Taro_024225, partial [Colocasia esculenta]|nr:hypothetical protein [Colocasia esculenta]